ncbi:helix-turn-helix domain-containing protein [Streptomyces tendae]|uniref:helix-turn-helix domain-containing protein n=1 Tax=Streptomyces TaxID=1883 RepID=UPI00365003BD
MTEHASRLEHLAETVRERRMELGMSIAAVAEIAGLSKDTFRKVEAAQPIREASYSKIDRALRLAPGSCRDVLDGADAVAVAADYGDFRIHTLTVAPETAARDAIASAAIATTGNLTAAEIRTLSDRIVEELRDRGVLGPQAD